jgi:hypothetical protein
MLDFFISHAHEDKESVARPLAEALIAEGFSVWFDDFSLRLGDSLRVAIDKGLSGCTYGIVILSPSFFAKQWPQWELDGLVARESSGQKVILPLWHDVSFEQVCEFSPMLAGRFAVQTEKGIAYVVEQILAAIKGETPHEPASGIETTLGFHVDVVNLRCTLLPNGSDPTWEYLHDSDYRFHGHFDEPLKFGVFAWHQSEHGVVRPEGSITVEDATRNFALEVNEVRALNGSDYEVRIHPAPQRGDWMVIRQQFRSPSFNATYAEDAPSTLVIHKNMRYNCIDGSLMTSRIERFRYRLVFPAEYPIDPEEVVPIVGTMSNTFDRVDEREIQRITREGRITRRREDGAAILTMDVSSPRSLLHYGFAWNALSRKQCTFDETSSRA